MFRKVLVWAAPALLLFFAAPAVFAGDGDDSGLTVQKMLKQGAKYTGS